MYVIHTRGGYEKPLHIGLGLSFSFDPWKDSYLVVPSSMQTILINANSICKELQGILIQGYVQWIIDDINVAYRKLDFSDIDDPMRVVNVQLGEQAQAAIKDKVATMSIREVLSDKQPIIVELTKRLKEVAEGSGDDQGLGIRIVTVQIKEAVVSSTTVWENLQKPFRTEQAAAARLAEIENQARVTERELEDRRRRESAQLETESQINELRAKKEAEQFDREKKEALRRHKAEEEAQRERVEATSVTTRLQQEEAEKLKEHEAEMGQKLEAQRIGLTVERYGLEEKELEARAAMQRVEKEKAFALRELELAEETKLKARATEAELDLERQRHAARNEQTEKELHFDEVRQRIRNTLSETLVQLRAVEMLPQVAESLPKPDRLETVAVGASGATSLEGMVASIMGVLKGYGVLPGRRAEGEGEPAAEPE